MRTSIVSGRVCVMHSQKPQPWLNRFSRASIFLPGRTRREQWRRRNRQQRGIRNQRKSDHPVDGRRERGRQTKRGMVLLAISAIGSCDAAERLPMRSLYIRCAAVNGNSAGGAKFRRDNAGAPAPSREKRQSALDYCRKTVKSAYWPACHSHTERAFRPDSISAICIAMITRVVSPDFAASSTVSVAACHAFCRFNVSGRARINVPTSPKVTNQ
jgi:hypothetical protein